MSDHHATEPVWEKLRYVAVKHRFLLPSSFQEILLFADIYVSCVSFAHNVASKGFYLAMVSTTVETDKPEDELKPAIQLLGPVKEK